MYKKKILWFLGEISRDSNEKIFRRRGGGWRWFIPILTFFDFFWLVKYITVIDDGDWVGLTPD